MADSKRQKIVDAVIARLKTITIANGFTTNIGSNPVEDYRQNFQEEELPATSVFDLPATAEQIPTNRRTAQPWTQPIQVRVYLKKGTDAKNARNVIKDIYQAIRSDDQWKVSGAPTAMFSTPKTEGFMQSENSFEILGVAVEFDVVYITQNWNAES